MEELDAIRINFDSEQVLLLNISLGFIMFGVALFLKWEDFRRLSKNPKSILVGLSSQLLLLPILTLILIYLLPITRGVALGMLLVASCPGGNISNFASAWSRSNATLSVSLTSIVTALSAFVTPVSFFFWAMFLPDAGIASGAIEVSLIEMLQTVVMIILIPLVLGVAFQRYFPQLTQKIKTPMSVISVLILVAFIAVALGNNSEYLLGTLKLTLWIVIIHNSLGYISGYWYSRAWGEPPYNARAISLETGIQNAGLGLVLIFNFFPEQGAMMIIAAWWGIWDIFSSLLLAFYWRRKTALVNE